MKILDSPLMGEFIAYLKSTWGGNSRVNQRRRRLRQLVTMVRVVADATEERVAVRCSSLTSWLELLRTEALRGQAVLDATSDPSAVVGSAKKFLAGIRTLFVCSAEVDRLKDAVEGLERLAGADLDVYLKVLHLDAMDVDAAAAPYMEQWSHSVATAPGLPVRGEKRKRAAWSSGDGDATSHGRLDPAPYRRKLRAVACRRHESSGDGDATSHGRLDRAPYRRKLRAVACRRHQSSGPRPDSNSSPLEVAMAMARVRRHIGKPNLGRRFSRISL